MRLAGIFALGLLAACASAAPPPADAPVRSLGEILEQSPASDWRAVEQNNLLYMQLPGGRVIIELAADYTPLHTANIQALARATLIDGDTTYQGAGVLEQFLIGPHAPSGFTSMLDGAP